LRKKQLHLLQMVTTVVILVAIVGGLGITYEMGMWHFPNAPQIGSVVTTQTITSIQPGGGYTIIQQTITQQGTTPLGASGASCQIALTRTEINMGESIAGQLTSNRAGVEVDVYHRLTGEPVSPSVITGLTDAQGSWIAFSGQLTQPGVYQILAALNFPSEGVQVPCTPTITLVVHGLQITVNPQVASSGQVTIDVYSDTPSTSIEVQMRLSFDPTWYTLANTPQFTNFGGHYEIAYVFNGHAMPGTYLFRAYNRGTGALSNEVQVTLP
jgi:hypothetical protein